MLLITVRPSLVEALVYVLSWTKLSMGAKRASPFNLSMARATWRSILGFCATVTPPALFREPITEWIIDSFFFVVNPYIRALNDFALMIST